MVPNQLSSNMIWQVYSSSFTFRLPLPPCNAYSNVIFKNTTNLITLYDVIFKKKSKKRTLFFDTVHYDVIMPKLKWHLILVFKDLVLILAVKINVKIIYIHFVKNNF